jgi:hypothetical protein
MEGNREKKEVDEGVVNVVRDRVGSMFIGFAPTL